MVFEEWETKKKLKVIPGVLGVLFVLIIAILFPGNPGMVGISILFSVIFALFPYTIYNYYQAKRVRAMEEQFPNFLRDLVENKKSGMTLPESLRDTAKNEYGKLTPQVQKMSKQISWDVSFDDVLMRFATRIEGSDLIQRSLRIIMEARRSGGDVVSTMETIANDASSLIEMEKERRSKMARHGVIMYLIYFMYLVITIILSKILIPMTEMETGGEAGLMGLGGGGGVCAGEVAGVRGIICSIFISLAKVFRMGAGMEAYYKGLFLSMILIQGILTGLIIGQIRNNSASSGIRHSMILTGKALRYLYL